MTVTFSGTATGGTLPYTFSWTFGDGSSAIDHSASGSTEAHPYTMPGAYTAILSVTDSLGLQNSASQTIVILLPAGGCPRACAENK